MKTNNSFLIYSILLCLFVTVSCNIEPFEGDIPDSSTENPDDVTLEDGTFQVDFDGQTFVADIVSATIVDNSINISGLRGNNGELVTITVLETTVGTYEFGVTTNSIEINGATYIEGNGSSAIWISVTNFIDPQGEISITDIDQINKTISGTFNFTGHNPSGGSKEFTNGSFTKIPYDSLQNNNDNVFFAKVDGEEFIEDTIQGFSTNLPGLSSIGIAATKNSDENITLTLDINITAGTYDFDSIGGLPNGQYNLSFGDSYLGEGTITISSHDVTNKRIVGDFQFMASSLLGGNTTFEITEGNFDVTYN